MKGGSQISDESRHEVNRQGSYRSFRSSAGPKWSLKRNPQYYGEPEKHNLLRLITRSGWLLLFTKLLISIIVKKVDVESSTEGNVANQGLLLKDVIRNFHINEGINLAIGIPLGILADFILGKKVIMIVVLCLSISFYFYMVVGELRPIWADERELLHWKTKVFLQTTLHSIRGIETVAMLESLNSEDFKLLYAYTFLKVIIDNVGRTIYIALYLLSDPSEDSDVIMCFVCLSLSIVVFFIWILFVSSLKHDSVAPGESPIMLRRMISACLWKIKLYNRDVGENSVKIGQYQRKVGNTKVLKKILYLCLIIIPSITTGFLYNTSINVLREPFSRLKSWEFKSLNLLDVSRRALVLITLPLVEFVVIPLMRQILRRKISFICRLMTSMGTGIAAYLYGILVVRMLMSRGSPLPDNWVSEVRFVNALNYSVTVRPVDKSHNSAVAAAKDEILLTYVRGGTNDFPARQIFEVVLESSFSYVAAVSLERGACVTYFISDFMEIQRVPGTDPIFEGPPGTNFPSKSRMYFANLDPELTVDLVLTFQYSILHDLKLDEPVIIDVKGGQKKVFQIDSGTYILTIAHTALSKSYTFGPGGVYGVIYSPEIKEETLDNMVVEILPPKSFSVYYAILFECLAWISISFVLVIMEVFVFIRSPHKWRSSAFGSYHFFNTGFLPLCHYIFNLVINDIGYVGWWTILIYGSVYLILCVVSGFILIKFNRYFTL